MIEKLGRLGEYLLDKKDSREHTSMEELLMTQLLGLAAAAAVVMNMIITWREISASPSRSKKLIMTQARTPTVRLKTRT